MLSLYRHFSEDTELLSELVSTYIDNVKFNELKGEVNHHRQFTVKGGRRYLERGLLRQNLPPG